MTLDLDIQEVSDLPPEVGLVLLLVVGKVDEVIRQLLGTLVVQDIYVGVGRSVLSVVCPAHN